MSWASWKTFNNKNSSSNTGQKSTIITPSNNSNKQEGSTNPNPNPQQRQSRGSFQDLQPPQHPGYSQPDAYQTGSNTRQTYVEGGPSHQYYGPSLGGGNAYAPGRKINWEKWITYFILFIFVVFMGVTIYFLHSYYTFEQNNSVKKWFDCNGDQCTLRSSTELDQAINNKVNTSVQSGLENKVNDAYEKGIGILMKQGGIEMKNGKYGFTPDSPAKTFLDTTMVEKQQEISKGVRDEVNKNMTKLGHAINDIFNTEEPTLEEEHFTNEYNFHRSMNARF